MSYFGIGRPFTQTVALPQPPEVAAQQLYMAVTGLPGTTPVQVGPGVILVTRRYIPTWAIVLAVIGFFFFLLGLLFLLVRNSETCEIRISAAPEGPGSIVVINGIADADTITRLQGVLMAGRPMAGPGAFYGGPPPQVNPGAPISPDGKFWWDGAQWRPLGPPTSQPQ